MKIVEYGRYKYLDLKISDMHNKHESTIFHQPPGADININKCLSHYHQQMCA